MPHRLLTQVNQAIQRHRMLDVGASVLVACSGGPDSLALLAALRELQETWLLTITAVYIDHGIRPESAAEGEYVVQLARRWGIKGVVRKVEVDLTTGGSVEARARAERYRLLYLVAAEHGCQRIAVGHTADDQAETLVMRFVRGTGCQGLAGIPPVNDRLIRPLLYTRRADTEDYCRTLGLVPVHDASNDRDDYLRNQLRHHLLPQLSAYNPQLVPALMHLADTAQAENDYMERVAGEFAAAAITAVDGGYWCPFAPFAELHLALQRRVVRSLARRLAGGTDVCLQELSYDHTAAVLALIAQGETGASLPLPGELTVWIEKGGFWIGRAVTMRPYAAPLPVPGEFSVPGTTLRLIARLRAGAGTVWGEVQHAPARAESAASRPWTVGTAHAVFDWNEIGWPLVVRSRRPGDRFIPFGMQGEKKLQDMYVDAGVPRRWRDRLPVVADQAGILWVPGLRRSNRAPVGGHTKRVLELVLHDNCSEQDGR